MDKETGETIALCEPSKTLFNYILLLPTYNSQFYKILKKKKKNLCFYLNKVASNVELTMHNPQGKDRSQRISFDYKIEII